MEKPKSVTAMQLTMSLGTTVIGVGILAFPRITVEYVKTGAPFSAAFGIVLMMCGALIVAYLGMQYQNKTIFEYADGLIGKWANKLVLVVIGAYFLELAALASREFGEVVVTSVLPRTPIAVTIIVMLLLATIACRVDISKFVRILTFYMPFVYFPALIIVFLSWKSARISNILPILAIFHGQDIRNVYLSIIIVGALFTNFLVVGLIVPFMYRPNQAMRGALLGMSAAGAVYIMIMYSTLSVFGVEEMTHLMWPTLELAKTATIAAIFIERVDPIFIAVWVTAVFSAIFASYYVALQAFGHLLRLKNPGVLSVPAFPIILSLAKQPESVVAMYSVIKRVGIIGVCLTLGYVLVLLGAHLIKTVRRGSAV